MSFRIVGWVGFLAATTFVSSVARADMMVCKFQNGDFTCTGETIQVVRRVPPDPPWSATESTTTGGSGGPPAGGGGKGAGSADGPNNCPIPIEKDAKGNPLICGRPKMGNWPCDPGTTEAYLLTKHGRERVCAREMKRPVTLKDVLNKTWAELQKLLLPANKRDQLMRMCDQNGGSWEDGEGCVYPRAQGTGTRSKISPDRRIASCKKNAGRWDEESTICRW